MMRLLILMMLAFASCKKITIQDFKKSDTEKEKTTVNICENEFQTFLQDSLEYFDMPSWSPFVVLIRNDQFVETLKTQFISCIKGKSESEIIELFGKPRWTKNENDPSLTYDCYPRDYRDNQVGKMCLIFKFDENDLVKYISYYDCWDVID